ncbi:class II fructose-bisphosphate aldolase [Floccifex sp.]|uniref:class II fructose-bisphosphate aldolase n=1 Tax=Floccifex sp. TaxID=2815810 RepID=UPI002A756A8F|nr:class II fructose-bisphosphate aldolase [Floccifex sp.]MDD7281743.1 class II fructose-bisphosphate aldolase [Erysipelotrichaceae bacterium]MDY2958618.1 class II fructose-bisphosphate aldolase [Floccifex sp.]
MYVSMKGMLDRANKGNYAIMAINCFNIETTRACIEAAQSLRAPIIINIVQEHMVNHCDSELIAPIVKKLAQRASVEVALNFDHGQEVPLIKKALHDGYSSVMVDASRYDLEGNIKMTREIVEFAQQFDASVEGEIGCMGGTEGKLTSEQMKTDPQQALRFAKETGIDALAISYGSSHGNYEPGYVPEFDFERLKEIKKLTQMPLVLHGGSGSGDENIINSVKYGINKINVGCDFMNANTEAIKKHLEKDPNINYWVMMNQVEKESQEIVKHYIRLSGSEGKSL